MMSAHVTQLRTKMPAAASRRRALQRLAALALVAAAVLAPASAQATTVTLYPTSNTVTGTVTAPTNAYATLDADAAASVSPNSSLLSLSGFDGTDRGTISDVTAYVRYKTSAAPVDDTYRFDTFDAVSATTVSIVAAGIVNQPSYVVASKSLGAIGWPDVAALAVKCQTAKSGSADAYVVNVEVAYVIVTYAAASGTITLGDGPNPGNVSITAGQTGALDGFNLVASPVAAAISSVTVSIGTGAAALSGLSIYSTSSCTGTSYGSIGSVALGANTINTTGSGLTAATSPGTTLYVCATGATVASSTTVTGTVSGVSTPGYTVTGTDLSGATSFTVTPPVSIPITLGDGPNPGIVSVVAGQQGALDGFNLTASTGSPAISSVTVYVRTGAAALSGLSIYSNSSCTLGTSYGSIGSVAPGANTINTTVPGLTAATSPGTNLYVCATGATVASNTPVTGTVSGFTTSSGGYSVGGTDPSGATSFTVAASTITLADGTNPGTVSIAAGQPGALDGFSLVASTGSPTISSVTVNIGSGAAALSGLSINSASNCGGTSYGSIGSVVAGANLIATPTLTATTTATTRYVCTTGGTVQFSTTATGTVSAVATSTPGYTVTGTDGGGATSFTVLATADTTTVGDAANPPSGTIDPGGVATAVDAFTLKTGIFNDTIQSVTVTLAPNVWQGIEAVSIQNVAACSGGTTYGSATPVGTTVGIGVSNLVASTAIKNLWVCVKPKAHAAMPLPPGGTYAVTANVTAIASSNAAVYQDTSASATVTIDNASPANVRWGAVTTGSNSVTLNWTNPGDSDFNQVVVLRLQGGPVADVPSEGRTYSLPTDATPFGVSPPASKIIYVGSAQTYGDSVTNGVPYYYAIFAKDSHGNYATGTSFGPVVPSATGTAFFAGDTAVNSTKPVVGIVNPGSGSVVAAGQSFRVQARVFSPGGAAISAVAVTHDGSTWPDPLYWVTAYGGSPSSGVWGGTISIPATGGYTLVVRATNAGGTTYSRPVGISVRTNGGDGTLLVRDNASQLCSDCHAMVPHSSEKTGSQYGSWSTTCRDCHTPHGTTNIKLVPNAITPPAIGSTSPPPKAVFFTNTTGFASTGGAASRTGSYANGDSTGVCQACHTRTQDLKGNPRYQNTGGGLTHDVNLPCKNCHAHGNGFAPTNMQCWNCHLSPTACGSTCTYDVDVWTWGGGTGIAPKIDLGEWTTYGHGRATNYLSGNPPPTDGTRLGFDAMGSAVHDHGCFYCHSSSTSHGDSTNWFRLNADLFNTTFVKPTGDGQNSVCLVCHGKTATWSATGYDPDGPGTAYALVAATKRIGFAHNAGMQNGGGVFCWDCHDPHGDRSASNADLWSMIQRRPVMASTGASGQPVTLAPAVEFRGNLGGDPNLIDFPDYIYPPSGTATGICRVCHSTATAHDNQSTYDSHPENNPVTGQLPRVGAGLAPGDRCTYCHVHSRACNECHDAPQAAGRHSQHDQVGSLPTSYTDVSSAATTTGTITQYGFRCAKCHQGTHPKDTHSGTIGDPFVSDMAFDADADPQNGLGTYARGSTVYTVQGMANGDYANKYWGWTDGTCASLYCHSNGAPVDATLAYTTIKWNTGLATNCSSCHGAKDTATTTMSRAHAKHVNSSVGNYAYGCERCHSSVVTGASAFSTFRGGGKVLHVNGTKDVAFDASGPNNSGGSYNKTTLKCSSTYCHSDGTKVSPSYVSTSDAWTAPSPLPCTSCHQSGATLVTGKHSAHLNNTGVIGTNFFCANCHNSVVANGNSPISTAGYALHVNGTANVAFSAIGTFSGGTYASPTCSSIYCHSSGQATPSYTSVAWNGAIGCNGCHGKSRTYGDPDYANSGAGQPGANSHAKHVSAAADCATCHTGTTTSGTAIVLSSTLHIDGSREVTWDATRQSGGATYTSGTKTCGYTGGSCHGTAGTPQWGAVVTCLNCHGTTGAEVDDFGASFWNNGIMATINTNEWTYSGHGKTTGNYEIGGGVAGSNPPANFPPPIDGTSECLYCHDSSVGHGTGTNPYRLRNIGGADGQNGNCLACHKTGSAGVTPSGQTIKNGTIKADTAHDGTKHTLPTQGGKFCWDCHDPHGSRPSNTDSSGNNIEMIRRQVFVTTDGTIGYPGSAANMRSVEYYNKTAIQASPSPLGRIAETSTVPPAAHKGICQACHDPTSPAPNPATAWSEYWGYTGYDDPDGAGGVAPYNSGAATAPTHKPTSYCIACHKHSAKFVGSGGGPDCLSSACHGASLMGTRRPVGPDFLNGTTPNFRSHHVGNGGAFMGGTLSNADCAVCHAEALVSGGVITDTDPIYHGNKKIDLRNVDSTTAVFTYDKDAVAASAGAAANWNSGNAVWRTETSTHLDPFCINCHDSDGALQIAAFKADAAATALNPFNDAKITNEYDQLVRCDGAPTMPGAKQPTCTAPGTVVDVKSMVTGSPPPKGINSRHAIRGQSTSIYTKYTALGGSNLSMYDAGRFTSMGTDENGKPNWNDTSVMGCADCHTSDGANGATGNSHGSSSEYLLKDSSGGAAEGTMVALNYVCYRCHFNNTTNHYYSGGSPHTANGGGIHGTSEMVPVTTSTTSGATVNCGTTPGACRNAYRFTNGASMRYYDPMGWTGMVAQCYTLTTGETGWGGCTKHAGGSGNRNRAFARPVTY